MKGVNSSRCVRTILAIALQSILSVFLREDTERNVIRVSLRSVDDFPCNSMAAEFFNGGGHLNASGGEFYGPMEEAVALFKQALVKYEDLLLGKNS